MSYIFVTIFVPNITKFKIESKCMIYVMKMKRVVYTFLHKKDFNFSPKVTRGTKNSFALKSKKTIVV